MCALDTKLSALFRFNILSLAAWYDTVGKSMFATCLQVLTILGRETYEPNIYDKCMKPQIKYNEWNVTVFMRVLKKIHTIKNIIAWIFFK